MPVDEGRGSSSATGAGLPGLRGVEAIVERGIKEGTNLIVEGVQFGAGDHPGPLQGPPDVCRWSSTSR